MTDSLPELVDRVAERTLDRNMESEDWRKAVAINGLLVTGQKNCIDAAQRLVDRSIETQTSSGYLSYGSTDPVPASVLDPAEWPDYDSGQWQCNGATIGQSVLEFYDRTGTQRYLAAAERQYEALLDADRTADGGISYNSHVTELWVDSLYMVPPFVAQYGTITDDADAIDEAITHITVQANHLQDPHTGLFRHIWREQPNSFPESTFWSRGNGWAAAGIIDTISILPDDHPDREQLVDVFRDLCSGVVTKQDASGYWHNVLDDRQSPLETSGTLMFSYAFGTAVEMGLLDEDPYLDAAQRGLDVCKGIVDSEGNVQRIAMPPGGPGVGLGTASFGQGWFLLAADPLGKQK
ncbi:glycosyl hydrolase family 88 [Salinadaptatus halalkaliphilus]|uniref:Glycosyl hydrolase family 88 n=1 Tax=Salinadaptatus halalkaliphilus TaxID=2419781 RepID=A0A4S3TKX0_9EURY|nr:glycoside hydrolase family 88 protein [Salinadaptatus halalkaliphilus]THE64696.1 glycosyl hydrolase family 88 [Salinadaptatus halalkaliphilus]